MFLFADPDSRQHMDSQTKIFKYVLRTARHSLNELIIIV